MNRLPCVLLAIALCTPAVPAQTPPELDRLETAQPPHECAELAKEIQEEREQRERQMMRPGSMLFASFDSDGDLAITPDELTAGLARVFPGVDANGDGSASILEYANWSERALGAREAIPGRVAVDPNLDNVVSEAEFFAAFRGQADLYGLARDGEITFAALLRTIRPDNVRREGGPSGGR